MLHSVIFALNIYTAQSEAQLEPLYYLEDFWTESKALDFNKSHTRERNWLHFYLFIILFMNILGKFSFFFSLTFFDSPLLLYICRLKSK